MELSLQPNSVYVLEAIWQKIMVIIGMICQTNIKEYGHLFTLLDKVLELRLYRMSQIKSIFSYKLKLDLRWNVK